MRNQKLKRMLGAAVLFILFSTGCRAGWDGFNEEIGNNGDLLDDQHSMYGIEDLDTSFIDFPFPEDDPFWNGEFFNSADLLADQQEQPAEHIPEASMAENAYTPLNIEELSSTAGPSTQENLYITGQNTQENLYITGPSMAENVYTAFNPEESAYVAGTSMADNNCMAGSSMTDSFFNDAYNRPSTSREEYRMPDRVDDIDFILRDFPEESCFWDSCHGDFGGTDGVASQYNQPMQYTPES
ncbi:hypothetical protein NEMIN01_2273, partial [Nematocida minor]|uniref:uncharacterized protein n=1 Tax=Nematocida minor TaxID=1912983 RepID=UPI00221F2661